jgi:hypothetical protein
MITDPHKGGDENLATMRISDPEAAPPPLLLRGGHGDRYASAQYFDGSVGPIT